jgi:hypothetical protein
MQNGIHDPRDLHPWDIETNIYLMSRPRTIFIPFHIHIYSIHNIDHKILLYDVVPSGRHGCTSDASIFSSIAQTHNTNACITIATKRLSRLWSIERRGASIHATKSIQSENDPYRHQYMIINRLSRESWGFHTCKALSMDAKRVWLSSSDSMLAIVLL